MAPSKGAFRKKRNTCLLFAPTLELPLQTSLLPKVGSRETSASKELAWPFYSWQIAPSSRSGCWGRIHRKELERPPEGGVKPSQPDKAGSWRSTVCDLELTPVPQPHTPLPRPTPCPLPPIHVPPALWGRVGGAGTGGTQVGLRFWVVLRNAGVTDWSENLKTAPGTTGGIDSMRSSTGYEKAAHSGHCGQPPGQSKRTSPHSSKHKPNYASSLPIRASSPPPDPPTL